MRTTKRVLLILTIVYTATLGALLRPTDFIGWRRRDR